jgi:C1A family cysteine protease
MQIYAASLWLLSCTLWNAAVAEISPDSRGDLSSRQRQLQQVVDAFDAKLPRLPAWQRALGASARVGPRRQSLEAQADALEATRRVLEQHNARHAAGDASYFLSWNALSDLSHDEYARFLKSRVDSPVVRKSKPRSLHSVYEKVATNKGISLNFQDGSKWDAKAASVAAPVTPLPKSYNWLEIENGKYLTPIKNQGSCGSCWAFSAVSVIESRFAIEHNVTATPLSVEQVLSCSAPLDHIHSKFPDMAASSNGCEGGMPFLAFEYMARMAPNGVACASDYPYVMATSVSETQCQSVAPAQVAVAWTKSTSDYVAVEPNSEDVLMRAVLLGPVSSNIDALGDGFRHYGGGIYDAHDCASDGKAVNHAVVIVGFGETDKGEKYWVLRNTWGTMWGENGYMRLARGTIQGTGPCNLYMFSTYPVKLSQGTATKDGVCATPTSDFVPLGWAKLMSYGGSDWALLLVISFTCLGAGVAVFVVTEQKHQRKRAAGQETYDDSYARWVLPTKEQTAAMLARRRPQHESV